MGCFQSKENAAAGEGKAPAPEKKEKVAATAPTNTTAHVAVITVENTEDKRASQVSDGVDVLAPVKEAERRAAEKELTEEEKADKANDDEMTAKVAALNEDPESEKAYKRESLKSEEEIGFVTVSADGVPSKKESIKSMPAVTEEGEAKKNSVEEPIIPESSNDPDQVLVGGAGSD